MADTPPEALKATTIAKPTRYFALLHRPLKSHLKRFVGLPLILLVALAFSPHSPRGGLIFLEFGNITDILRQISEIGIISLGMTFVILTGGIDLSVGTVLALSSSIVASLLTRTQWGVPASIAISLSVGAAVLAGVMVGVTNGVVIARWRIQPFIVTLATMIGVRGLARGLTSNTNIDIGFGTDMPSVFAGALSGRAVVIGSYVVLSILLALLLSNTIFGRHIRAIGDNEKAAQYAGLPIAKTKILAYAMTGLLAGYSGVLHAAQNHQGNPNAGVAYELEAIAAVVIGGTSLMGGSGSILGTVVGTLIMGVITNILRLNNVDNNLEMIAKAAIIIAAVWLQQKGKESA